MEEAGVDFSREGATIREGIFSCGEGGAPGGKGVLLGWVRARLGMLEVRLITGKSEERQAFLSWDSRVKVRSRGSEAKFDQSLKGRGSSEQGPRQSVRGRH